MDVICSGFPSKGILSTEECKACALARENTCGYDYALLKNMFGKADRSGIHVTDLTGCLRKAFFDKTDPQPRYVHEILVLTLGTAVHAFLEEDDEWINCELSLEAEGVLGTADVVYKADGRVIDYKTTRWLNPSKLPYGSHELQVNIYAYLLEQSGRPVRDLFIQYIDMSGPTKCKKDRVAVRPDENGYLTCPVCGTTPRNAHLGVALFPVPKMHEYEIEELVTERRDELVRALSTGDAEGEPQSWAPPDAETGFLCSYCAHVDKCQEGKEYLGR